MHDIKFIRNNAEDFDAGMERRAVAPQAEAILQLDAKVREAKQKVQEWQTERKRVSKEIGIAKSQGDHEKAKHLQDEIADSGVEVHEKAQAQAEEDLNDLLSGLPNIPADDVPEGTDENDNKEVRVVGDKPSIATPQLHDDMISIKQLMDFDAAAQLSGARFVVLRGALARMERALANFMLDIHTSEFGYTEIVPPYMVRDNAMFGTGQLPKFEEDLFKTTNDYWLIPTAEVPLTNLAANQILDEDALRDSPMRMTAYTPCFRSEAGAAGKDTRGMIRQHQFSKVELVSVVHPDQSKDEHERMTACAEEILTRLGLHYRVMLLCTGDMGFGANKTYDLEVWMPGQNLFREISSCSNCGDFQARRMKTRYKAKSGKETHFVHTLNGSGLAIGRTMIAVLENYQQADGSILIPDALKPYMGGIEKIEAA